MEEKGGKADLSRLSKLKRSLFATLKKKKKKTEIKKKI